MAKLIHRLLPRYGNWGGPGWSGGQWQDNYENTDWSVPPTDALDALFKDHDKAYQQAIANLPEDEREDAFNEADLTLSKEADKLPVNPNNWYAAPTTASWLYAYIYRKLVIFLFNVRGSV